MIMADQSLQVTVRLVDHVPPKTAQFNAPEEIEPFISVLNSTKHIDVLHLSQVSIGKSEAVILGNALANHGELQELHMVAAFKGKQIDEVLQCLEAISAGVAQSRCQLKLLDISENAFRGTGIRGMQAILTSQTCFKLEVLKMSDLGLSPEGGQVLGDLLMELHRNAALEGQQLQLRVFKSSKHRLEDPGAIAVGRAFTQITSLQEVEVYQCGINAVGITNLLQGLSANKELRRLDILDNNVNSPQAEQALANAIKSWPRLEDLRLNSCLITDNGMLAVLRALQRHCRGLKILDIGDNSVEGSVEEEVLKYLTGMPTLQSVVLAGNDFYDKKRVKTLFQQKFAEIGKGGIIKSSLDDGHTYGLDGDQDSEEEESGEEDGDDDVENVNDSDKETGEVSDGEENEDGDAEHDQENGKYGYILDVADDSMWSVTLPDYLEKQEEGLDADDVFGRRVEQNNFYTTLGIFVTDVWNTFDKNKTSSMEIIPQLVIKTAQCIETRAEEDEAKSIQADHELDAVLQFTEYLMACSVFRTQSSFLQDFFAYIGLVGSGQTHTTEENQLCATAWLVRHLLYSEIIPLREIGRIDRILSQPQSQKRITELRNVEGFNMVFDELRKQAEM